MNKLVTMLIGYTCKHYKQENLPYDQFSNERLFETWVARQSEVDQLASSSGNPLVAGPRGLLCENSLWLYSPCLHIRWGHNLSRCFCRLHALFSMLVLVLGS
jgi:hypothetical protein